MAIDGISVLWPTYGRAPLLAEALECYLRQDWGGPSELIIYNDLAAQFLKLPTLDLPPHKRIEVLNSSVREPTLGDKRNTLLREAKYPLVTYWDDDDIYLPHRLSLGFILMHNFNPDKITQRESTREYKEWHLLPNNQMLLKYARPFGTMTARKAAIEDVGGFPPLERLQDVAMVNKMVRAGKLPNMPQVDWMPSTIYRLHSAMAGSHVSDAPNYPTTDHHNPAHNEGVRQYIVSSVQARIQLGEEPTGTIEIKPHWKADYLSMAEVAWTLQNPRLRNA